MNTHRFPIGTQYTTRGKHPQVCTVVDQLTTTNSKGDVVRTFYVTEHQFCGQSVRNYDVVDPTIAMGLLPEYAHLIGQIGIIA